jgi:3',5'-cyclic-nucleotide phosphodiesterase
MCVLSLIDEQSSPPTPPHLVDHRVQALLQRPQRSDQLQQHDLIVNNTCGAVESTGFAILDDVGSFCFPVDRGVRGFAVRTGAIVNLDVYPSISSTDPPPVSQSLDQKATAYSVNHIAFDPAIDELAIHGFQTKHIVCVPIRIDGKVIGLLTAINKIEDAHTGGHTKEEGEKIYTAFSKDDELFLEFVATVVGVAEKRMQLHRATVREQARTLASLAVLRALAEERSIDATLRDVVDIIYKCFEPELVTFYICDPVNQTVSIYLSKDGLQGLTLKYGQGIAGIVAQTGQPIRLSNAYADPRFLRHVDEKTGLWTHRMLCVGVPGFGKEGSTIAVLQLINKKDGTDFDKFDEESMTRFCQELSLLLHRKMYELSLFRMSSYLNTGPERLKAVQLEKSLLKEYGGVRRNSIDTFWPPSSSSSPTSSPASASRKRLSTGGDKPADFPEESLSTNASSKFDLLFGFEFNVFECTDYDLFEATERLFMYFGLMENFGITSLMLREFMVKLHSLYKSDVSFHNFQHVWSVFHVSCMILIHGGAVHHLSPKSILALCLAALCHDLDHPGNSNGFEISCETELAILYSNDSVLERHHAALAQRLLFVPRDQASLLHNTSPEDRKWIKNVMISAILSTDMTLHFKHVEALQLESTLPSPFPKEDDTAQQHLIKHILHCADLSGQVLPWHLAEVWGRRCIAEFRAQSLKEKANNVPLTPHMDGLDDTAAAMRLQHGFVSNIVLPLWTSFVDCFPGLLPCVEQCRRNCEYYIGSA